MLLLDTGDALIGGGKLGDRTKGEAVVTGMNLMGYDAMALGPKELSLGEQVLQQRMDEAEFPMLSANVVRSGTEDLLARPYAILAVADHRVGIVGLTRASDQPAPGFDVGDPLAALAQYVPEAAQEADTIVLITNLKYASALSLADDVPGIDLVIAGLPERIPPKPERAARTDAIIVTAERATRGHSGRHVGILSVTLESDGSLAEESWTVRSLDKSIVDDPEMKAALDRFEQ